MKTKRLLFRTLLMVLFTSGFFAKVKGQKSVNLGRHYRFLFEIHLADESLNEQLTLGDETNNGANKVVGASSESQWLIMPTYPKSNDFIIVEKSTGKVLDVSKNSNGFHDLIAFPTYNGDKNQIFQLPRTSEKIELFNIFERFIISPEDNQKAIKRIPSPGSPSGFAFRSLTEDVSGILDDRFLLVPSESILNPFITYIPFNNKTIPQPPAPTGFDDTNLCSKCPEQLVAETIIPFVMVDDNLPVLLQMQTSPYYKIKRVQYWNIVGGAPRTLLPGIATDQSFTVTRGIAQSSQTEVNNTLNMSFTATAGIEVNTPFARAHASTAFQRELGTSVTSVNSVSENFQTTETYSINIAPFEKTLIAEYQLVDRYILERMDGTVVSDWEVGNPRTSNTMVMYTESGLNKVNIGKRVLVDSKATPANLTMDAPVSAGNGYSVDLKSGNAFTDALDLQITSPEPCEVKVILHRPEGNAFKNIRKDFYQKGQHELSIDGLELPKGLYILKTQITGNNGLGKPIVYEQKVVKE